MSGADFNNYSERVLADYPQLQFLMADALTGFHLTLGQQLLAVYVTGSLAAGDFDPSVSDIDLVVVVEEVVTPKLLPALANAHTQLLEHWRGWRDRIEILYVSRHGLLTFMDESSPLAVISPGENLHIVDAGEDWLLNWNAVREHSICVYGPPATAFIRPIPWLLVVARIREDLRGWPHRIENDNARHNGWLAYAVLTVCRGACTLATSQLVSKIVGAQWARQQFPEHAPLIERALTWRQHHSQGIADPADYEQAVFFIKLVVAQTLNTN